MAPEQDCNGTCQDTSSDPKHCGSCDTACDGTPCALGTCATRVSEVCGTYAGKTDTHIVWIGDDHIVSVPRGGGAPSVVSSTLCSDPFDCEDVTVRGAYAYAWREVPWKKTEIARADLASGATVVLWSADKAISGNTDPGIAVDDEHLHWVFTGGIHRMPVGGGAPALWTKTGCASALFSTGTHLYYACNYTDSIMRRATQLPPNQQTGIDAGEKFAAAAGAARMFADADALYWIGVGELGRKAFASAGKGDLIDVGGGAANVPLFADLDAGNLFVVTEGAYVDEEIRKIDGQGGATLLSRAQFDSPFTVAGDGSSVYWCAGSNFGRRLVRASVP